MSEEKTKKLRHVTEKPREKPKMRLKFASLVLTAGLFVLPGCGRNEPQKPVEKAPAAEVSEKADEKEESAERKQEREMVNRRISKLKHVLGLLGGNESDVGLDEEEMETVLIVVENTRKVAGLYSESGPVEVNHPLVVLSVDTAIVDAVYEDASRDTKHAVAELLGLSLHSEGQLTYDEYLLFHSLSFESEEEHFSDLFGVVADIKAGKYDNVKVMSPLLSTPDSVATIMPSIEVEGKTDEVAKPAYELTNALIRALEEADISKEELAEFKTDDFRNEVAVEVFKNEANKKKFGEVVFRMFYEKASSKETKSTSTTFMP